MGKGFINPDNEPNVNGLKEVTVLEVTLPGVPAVIAL